MKKNLAKKVTLSILAGAVLMSSSVVWAADVTGNIVVVTSTQSDPVYGAYIGEGSGNATYNTVKVSGNGAVINSNLKGAYIPSYTGGDATNNAVEISGGTLKSGKVYGGETYSGNANYNTVTISGGTFTFGGSSPQQIVGGFSHSGNATGNVINISGGTFSGDTMIAAGAGDSLKIVDNNVINLSGTPNLANVNLVGKFDNVGTGSNNVLNVKFTNATGNNIKSIKYFNVINFDNLTWNTDANKSVITVDELDINNTTINAWITNKTDEMGPNENMTLITNTTNSWGSGVSGITGNVYIGVSSQAYDSEKIKIQKNDNKVVISTLAEFPEGVSYVPTTESLTIAGNTTSGYKYKVDTGAEQVGGSTVVALVDSLENERWAYEIASAYIGKTRVPNASNKTVTLKDAELVFVNPHNTGSALVGARFNDSGDVLKDNKVIINNSTFGGGNVYGALAQAKANNNSVEIIGGKITDTAGGINGDIYGAKVEDGTASGNFVSVSGNSELAGEIYGVRAKGDASENKVTITVGEVYGDYIYGGYSETGKASGNVITIDGGTIGNVSNTTQIYAGDTGVSGGAIENNIINLSGAPDLKNAELHAGSKVGTGNVLNVGYNVDVDGKVLGFGEAGTEKKWSNNGGKVRTIQNFNVINFNNLKWENGDTVIETTGNLKLDNTQINVWITDGKVTNEEESMTLIKAGDIDGNIATNNQIKVYDSISTIIENINGLIEQTGNAIIITLNGKVKANDTLEITKDSSGYKFKVTKTGDSTPIAEVTGLADKAALIAALEAKGWGKEVGSVIYVGRVESKSNQKVILNGATLELLRNISDEQAIVGSLASDNTTLNGNAVEIKDASFTGNAIYGAKAQGNATNNSVVITNSAIYSEVYGAYTSGGTELTGNSIEVEGTSTIDCNIYGAYSANAGVTKGESNKVSIEKASVKDVYGAYLTNGNAGSDGKGNSVAIKDGTVNSSVYGAKVVSGTANYNKVTIDGTSKVEQQVHGAKVDAGTASHNTVEIKGTADVNSNVYGAQAKGNVTGNKVDISSGTFDATSQQIYGGYSVNGKADGNTVYISGGSFGDVSIFAGHSVGDTANYNTMNLSGNPVLDNVRLLGGTANATGNELNIKFAGQGWSANSKIKSIQNFNVINFSNLTWNEDTSKSVITVDQLKFVDGNGTKVNAWLESNTGMAAGDKMTLITVNDGIIGGGKLDETGSKVYIGIGSTTPDGDAVVKLNDSNKIQIVVNGAVEPGTGSGGTGSGGTTPGTVRNDQILVLGESRAAATAFVNQGAELLETGMNALARNDEAGVKTFAAVYGNNSEYETGSHVNVNGWSGIVGVGKTNANGLTVGAFFENGDGNYSTHNVVGGEYIRGDGEAVYNGGGFLLRKDNASGVYTETSLRAGNLKNELRGAVRGPHGLDGYDVNTTYYGAHVGIGKVMPRGNDGDSLDVYGKFLYTYHDGETFDIQGEQVEFDSVNSERLRLGFRLNEVNGKKATMYYGAAWEYEFNGDASDKMLTYDLETPSLGGSTIIGELGFRYVANEKWSLDTQVRGYAGQREGFSGSVQANYAF